MTNAPASNAPAALLELRAIDKHFGSQGDWLDRLLRRAGWLPPAAVVQALAGVDLQVEAAQTVGLAGESGCGKSTLGRIAVGLLAPSRGERRWEGVEFDALPAAARSRTRLALQMVFQNAAAALDPRLPVSEQLAEAPRVHRLIERSEQTDFVAGLLQEVGLDAALASSLPHQLSGGQRARIGIARALAVQPRLLVCDEAVAALDVSVQAQVLNLLMELRERRGLANLFISHDLGVVRHLCERVLIMYLGRIVENAPATELFARPAHPYTRALLAAAPTLKVEKKQFLPIRGEPPSALAPPSGCAFHSRCPHAFARCREEIPLLREIAPGHRVACYLDFDD